MMFIIEEDEDHWKATVRQVFLEEFPSWEQALTEIQTAGMLARNLDHACERFFDATRAPWQRYDDFLAYWKHRDPRLPEYEDGELVTDSSYREAGTLLAHRMTQTYYASRRRPQLLDNVDDRPYWRLRTIEDGWAYPDCVRESTVVHRFDSPYWNTKKIPCERLFCRCHFVALTNDQLRILNN